MPNKLCLLPFRCLPFLRRQSHRNRYGFVIGCQDRFYPGQPKQGLDSLRRSKRTTVDCRNHTQIVGPFQPCCGRLRCWRPVDKSLRFPWPIRCELGIGAYSSERVPKIESFGGRKTPGGATLLADVQVSGSPPHLSQYVICHKR